MTRTRHQRPPNAGSWILRRWLAATMPLAAVACSSAAASDATEPEIIVLHEVAKQVTVSKGFELARLDGPDVEEGVGGAILLNSELVANGTFHEMGTDSTVKGGKVIGTMHGECMTSGGDLSLRRGAKRGTVAKCEQAMNFYGRGQVILSGLVEQQSFEDDVPQSLAVLGGTGDFVGVTGELVVTQLVFPGLIKKLELRLRSPE